MAYVDSFLIVRAKRRSNVKLDTACIQAEKQLEWLEGLAKYAESKSYTLASTIESEYKFKNKNTYWELERKQQLSKLGKSGGDNRFYHSGAAQAYILDRLDSSWKENIMDDQYFLEDMIRRKICMDNN